MDYERLWLDLKDYLEYLEEQRVTQVAPEVIVSKMDDLYNLADKDDQLANMAVQTGLGPDVR